MRIEFDSEKQKEELIDFLVGRDRCPSEFDIKHADNCSLSCDECWENAILCSVADGD